MNDNVLKRNHSKLRNFKPITQLRSINPPKRKLSDKLLSDLDLLGVLGDSNIETHRLQNKDVTTVVSKKNTMYISPVVSSRATTNQNLDQQPVIQEEDLKNYMSNQKANRKIKYRFKSIDRQLGR